MELRFSVEVFGPTGFLENSVGAGIFLAPGESGAVVTQGTTYTFKGNLLLANSFDPRSARIVATSTRLTCSASVLEPGGLGSLPSVGWQLPVVNKTRQKGD